MHGQLLCLLWILITITYPKRNSNLVLEILFILNPIMHDGLYRNNPIQTIL